MGRLLPYSLLLGVLACILSLYPLESYAMPAYLSICTGSLHERPIPALTGMDIEYVSISSRQSHWLQLSPKKPPANPACQPLELPLDTRAIQWIRLISERQYKTLQDGMMFSSPNPQYPDVQAELMPLTEPPPSQANKPDGDAQSKPPASPEAIQHKTLSTWLWQPQLWQQANRNGLWSQLQDANLHQVFITIPLEKAAGLPKDVEALKAFIRQATAKHIAVWAVEGDPWFILPDERENALWRARALSAYNRQAHPDEQLAGVQYDIEPYLIPGFDLETGQGYQAYLETIRALKHAQEMPLDLVVPFWLSEAENGSVMEQLAPWTDRVTVMDYRTDPAQIQAFASPWLTWGERHARRVQIALEAGHLPDETRFIYRPAAAGELWHIPWANQHVLVLLNAPASNPFSSSFAFSHKKLAPSSALTFAGQLSTLIGLIPDLQARFARWPSYKGLALHQYLEISKTSPWTDSDFKPEDRE